MTLGPVWGTTHLDEGKVTVTHFRSGDYRDVRLIVEHDALAFTSGPVDVPELCAALKEAEAWANR